MKFRLRVVEGYSSPSTGRRDTGGQFQGEVVVGTLYFPLRLDQNGKTINPCGNHQCWWIGQEAPCDSSGAVMGGNDLNPGDREQGRRNHHHRCLLSQAHQQNPL